MFHSDGAEAVLQLLLPNVLGPKVLTQVHHEHGHQGVEQTLALLQSLWYWPGMSAAVAQWCQTCDRCQVAEDVDKVLVVEWVYKFGVPAWVHSDQGRNFESY